MDIDEMTHEIIGIKLERVFTGFFEKEPTGKYHWNAVINSELSIEAKIVLLSDFIADVYDLPIDEEFEFMERITEIIQHYNNCISEIPLKNGVTLRLDSRFIEVAFTVETDEFSLRFELNIDDSTIIADTRYVLYEKQREIKEYIRTMQFIQKAKEIKKELPSQIILFLKVTASLIMGAILGAVTCDIINKYI